VGAAVQFRVKKNTTLGGMMPEGLLHIGAMAVLLGAGYLKLDRIGATSEELTKKLSEIRSTIRGWVKSLNRQFVVEVQGKKHLDPVFDTVGAHYIMHLAGENCNHFSKLQKVGCIGLRIYYSPFHKAFMTGTHRLPVAVLTAISIALFILAADGTIWDDMPLWHAGITIASVGIRFHTIAGAFIWFCVTILWVFASVLVSRRLTYLDNNALKFMQTIRARDEAARVNEELRKLNEAYERAKNTAVP
jgi:hypothetical protein